MKKENTFTIGKASKRQASCLCQAAVAAVILSTILSPAAAFEKLFTGQIAYIACKSVTVHSNPSALSPITANLTFGNTVKILDFAKIFSLPDSDYQSRTKLEQANARARKQGKTPPAITKDDYTRPAWVQIGSEQYLPATCLVGDALFKEQTLKAAEEKVAAVITKKAKRNFTEEEDGDLRAMRGAAGKAVGGKADFAKIDKLIKTAQGKLDPATQKAFRKAGRLGEFK